MIGFELGRLLRRAIYSLFCLLSALPLLSQTSQASIIHGWTQYSAGGLVEARIATEDATCPTLILDGQPMAMTERHRPDEAFALRICVAPIPLTAKSILVEGIPLPVPVAHPRRIVVLGDTGCRLTNKLTQSCDDPDIWPFARVAAMAAAEHPDLVIHVGDYLYRETPCPDGNSGCAGSPFGDNWPTWDADLFHPAAPLMQAATWLPVRGNHEECKRAGRGWTATLGYDPVTAPCSPHDRPVIVDLDGFRVGLLDDNDADDKPKEANEAVVARLHADLAVLLAADPAWLLTHHPVRGVSKKPPRPSSLEVEGFNATLDQAMQGLPENNISLHMSGHIHNFQIANYEGPLPPQLVAGMGGTRLDTDVPPFFQGLHSGTATIKDGFSKSGFGYVVMERQAEGWSFDVHSLDGQILRQCLIKAHAIHCQ